MKFFRIIAPLFYFLRFILYVFKERSFMFLRYYPGHYSSPIPGRQEVTDSSKDTERQARQSDIAGVNLNSEEQQTLLESFYRYGNEFDFPEHADNKQRYFFNNPMFGYNDAFILYCFLREFSPAKLIEIGSGYSSAMMLDYRDRFTSNTPELTFIEPYPERLNRLLRPSDRNSSRIIENNIQDVAVDEFSSLAENDILFVDSSHVLRIGSDLSKIIFHILPELRVGVLIQFHDIFWPFDYPKVILDDGRLWNEAYLLRSFLQYNDSFEIVYFSSYMESRHIEVMTKKNPQLANGTGSSLWLRKIK